MSMTLYSWGANTHGQLCLGFKSEEVFDPSEVNLKECSLYPNEIGCIVGGGGNTLILFNNGSLVGCGVNVVGQIGDLKSDVTRELTPTQQRHLFKSVATKWDFTLGITKTGKVLAWGSNWYGQLGRKKESVVSSGSAIEIPIQGRAVQVACGIRHGLILTHDGVVYSGGDYKRGQLGRKFDPNKISGYHVVPGLSRVKAIACGQNHNLALTESNRLYGWGWNKHGQLGHKTSVPVIEIPIPIRLHDINLDAQTTLHAGWTHSALLTGSGTIINWGRNNYGQLGRPTEGDFDRHPAPLNSENFKQLSVGSEHNLAIQEDNTVWAWGWNEHGSCGFKRPSEVLSPKQVTPETCLAATNVYAGTGHSFAIFE